MDLRSGVNVDGEALVDVGYAGVVGGPQCGDRVSRIHSISNDVVVGAGDVIRLRADGKIDVLFRRGANANSLFVTEACNSICVMCSQPPRDVDDAWRVAELIELVSLVDRDVAVLGVTGGEPTLLGDRLVDLLTVASKSLPGAGFHVLSNGRLFAAAKTASSFDGLRGRIVWAVPVYGDNAADHDTVVGVPGAFAETMHGLYNLAERGHRLEIRMVISALTLPRLAETAGFYARNLPFAEHVALMGMEPMGFAKVNAAMLAYDPAACGKALMDAVSILDQAGMAVSVYNVPLCMIEEPLRRFARRSISDWKNEFAPACDGCSSKPACCGFFRSAGDAWRRAIRPILGARA
ncbi:His-Xaa-Ser system radical SAM maturase HxsC [Tardiphaga sp. OK245]|nr:His-Xaa-Ser system radical SAM maturase HxsC [Tardiphaga sp. OK245]